MKKTQKMSACNRLDLDILTKSLIEYAQKPRGHYLFFHE